MEALGLNYVRVLHIRDALVIALRKRSIVLASSPGMWDRWLWQCSRCPRERGLCKGKTYKYELVTMVDNWWCWIVALTLVVRVDLTGRATLIYWVVLGHCSCHCPRAKYRHRHRGANCSIDPIVDCSNDARSWPYQWDLSSFRRKMVASHVRRRCPAWRDSIHRHVAPSDCCRSDVIVTLDRGLVLGSWSNRLDLNMSRRPFPVGPIGSVHVRVEAARRQIRRHRHPVATSAPAVAACAGGHALWLF